MNFFSNDDLEFEIDYFDCSNDEKLNFVETFLFDNGFRVDRLATHRVTDIDRLTSFDFVDEKSQERIEEKAEEKQIPDAPILPDLTKKPIVKSKEPGEFWSQVFFDVFL